jgi:deoxycytidylate deaminase
VKIDYKMRAELVARRSSFKRFKTGAILTRGDSLLGVGWSHIPQHRMARLRAAHAEQHALLRARGGADLEGATLYIATVNKGGNLTMSLPCRDCYALLQEHGIRRIIYSTLNGWEELDMDDLKISTLKCYS